jgi:hypothetical protein
MVVAHQRYRPPKFAVWPSLTLDECERLAAENAAAYQKLASEPTPETRQRPIIYRNSAGDQFTSTLEDILTPFGHRDALDWIGAPTSGIAYCS